MSAAPKRQPKVQPARPEPTPLARRIAHYRKQQGLTMQQLAAEVGVSESYISFLESGGRSPSRKLIKKLVSCFYPQGNPDLLDEWLLLAGFSPERAVPVPPDPNLSLATKLSADQQDLRTQFAYIRSLIKSGELESARRQIQHCFQLFDGSIEVQSLAGSLELAKGHYDGAIVAQETALTFYRQQPAGSTRLTEADLLLSLGVSWFLKAYHFLGVYHQAESQDRKQEAGKLRALTWQCFASAREIFTQALALAPDDIYILDELTRVSFNLAHLAEAAQSQALWQETIKAYQQVLRHRDNRLLGSEALLETALFLGHAHAKAGEYERAEEMLCLIQAIRPEYWLAHYARACLLSLMQDEPNRLDEALEHLARAIQLDSSGQARAEARRDPDLAYLRSQRSAALTNLTEPVNGKASPKSREA